MRLAIVCAMEQELSALLAVIADEDRQRIGGREFVTGTIAGAHVILVRCGVGKVAAAATVAALLSRFEISALFLVGVAGGLGDGVDIGDVVVASELLQHDMDASPWCARFEVPHHRLSRFPTDARLASTLCAAAGRWGSDVQRQLGVQRLLALGIDQPRVHHGLIVSGDRFIGDSAASSSLRAQLPDALAVEMEGAAVAQVCAEFEVPLAVLRIVSDRADDGAARDFSRFVTEIASDFTLHLALAWLQSHATQDSR